MLEKITRDICLIKYRKFPLRDFEKDTDKEILYKTPVRKLTPKEALLLQGFPTDFCQNALDNGVSEHQLYIQAGNALSVNTGYALLHYLFIKSKIQYKKIPKFLSS